jgi:hypothetical protein
MPTSSELANDSL